MLEELNLTLPRFQVFEETLPLDRELQRALVDVYFEIICFYAWTIHFLRSNPHLVLRITSRVRQLEICFSPVLAMRLRNYCALRW